MSMEDNAVMALKYQLIAVEQIEIGDEVVLLKTNPHFFEPSIFSAPIEHE